MTVSRLLVVVVGCWFVGCWLLVVVVGCWFVVIVTVVGCWFVGGLLTNSWS